MSIYESAKEIIKELNDKGYKAYFAGGWVRDFLFGHPSSDIDIATDALPEKIIELFPKTVAVGISFGVVVVIKDDHHFEVATFRSDLDYHDGRRPSKIVYSDEEEDAKRRDFTINGMFYDPIEERVIDYVNGQKDLKEKVIRTIGDPKERFEEDRLRMIRAVRFAYRFDFTIDEKTRIAIREQAHTLFPAVAIERVWQELKKMAEFPRFDLAIIELYRLGLLQEIFPEMSSVTLEELKKRVQSFAEFPPSCPPILYIMELFPEKQLEVCQFLKVSNSDQKLVAFTSQVRDCLQNKADNTTWARIYSHPSSQLALEVIAARLSDKKAFLSGHKEKRKKLEIAIKRIQEQTPLVSSEDLKNEGISPGKTMGALLERAETIAINHGIDDKKEVIDLLKQSELWPEK